MNLITSNVQTMSSRENITRSPIPCYISEYVKSDESGNLYWLVDRSAGVKRGDKIFSLDGDGYLRFGLLGKRYKAHRVVFYLHYGYCPDHIDHIDGNKTNNKISNLREVSHSQNMMNSKIRSTSTTGVAGVTYDHRHDSWVVRICVDGKRKYVGGYKSLLDACAARFSAERKHYKEHSPLVAGRKLIHELVKE